LPLDSPKIESFALTKQLSSAMLNLNEFAVYLDLTDKRSIEKQAALYVVRTVLQDNAIEILYEDSGKPYLVNDIRISISHSFDWLVVLFSFNGIEIGVDIEKVRDKILNIKEKFLSGKELEDLRNASHEKYTIYWCVKEALYKALNIRGLNFAEQIFIADFIYSQAGGEINASVYDTHSKKTYTLHYQVLDNYILVYTANNCE
jgi:4'-phosphopantetheinyl transferase